MHWAEILEATHEARREATRLVLSIDILSGCKSFPFGFQISGLLAGFSCGSKRPQNRDCLYRSLVFLGFSTIDAVLVYLICHTFFLWFELSIYRITSSFTRLMPGRLTEFCRYHANLSDSGTRAFPVPVEFDGQKLGWSPICPVSVETDQVFYLARFLTDMKLEFHRWQIIEIKNRNMLNVCSQLQIALTDISSIALIYLSRINMPIFSIGLGLSVFYFWLVLRLVLSQLFWAGTVRNGAPASLFSK